jgi:hypothetical protein
MSTKLVTSYYASYFGGEPYWGKQSRDEWYAYSIISICNLGAEVICYTNDDTPDYDFINNLKQKHNLDNLTIKLFNLQDSPFHTRIYNIRKNNADVYDNPLHPFYILPVSIYWLKWYFLNLEYQENIYLYWIDAGLSTGSLIPYALNKYKDEEGFASRYQGEGFVEYDHRYKHFIFDQAFNSTTMEKINTFVEDKILCLCRGYVMDNDYQLLENKIGLEFASAVIQSNQFPVAAMFGGNSSYLPLYISKFNEIAELILNLPEQDYLCTEQEIMGYIHVTYPEWFKKWEFSTFYHEESDNWEVLHNENYELKSFYKFFTDPLE